MSRGGQTQLEARWTWPGRCEGRRHVEPEGQRVPALRCGRLCQGEGPERLEERRTQVLTAMLPPSGKSGQRKSGLLMLGLELKGRGPKTQK